MLPDWTGETVHLNLATPKGPVSIAERQTSHPLRFFASVGMIDGAIDKRDTPVIEGDGGI
jgi:hypothetical protein